MLKKIFSILLMVFLSFQFIACSSGGTKNPETAESIFSKAQELDKDERYDEAIRKYTEVKNKFPYSKLATQSELAIADAHFKAEAYPEAQATYQIFKELHPKHPQIDYVTFRLGLSLFHQLPSTIDRDLTIANLTISVFDEVIKSYSSSEFIKETREKRQLTLKMIAEKEIYIANFYFKKTQWKSALSRYYDAAKKFGGLGFDEISLGQAKIAADKAGSPQTKSDFEKIVIEKKAKP